LQILFKIIEAYYCDLHSPVWYIKSLTWTHQSNWFDSHWRVSQSDYLSKMSIVNAHPLDSANTRQPTQVNHELESVPHIDHIQAMVLESIRLYQTVCLGTCQFCPIAYTYLLNEFMQCVIWLINIKHKCGDVLDYAFMQAYHPISSRSQGQIFIFLKGALGGKISSGV
jgi:hypothetical protein